MESLEELRGGAAATRIGEALNTVTQMAASVPVAAVVLVSDGADTGGQPRVRRQLARLAAAGIPVHTVGVGPEQPQNDLELAQLQVPDQRGGRRHACAPRCPSGTRTRRRHARAHL